MSTSVSGFPNTPGVFAWRILSVSLALSCLFVKSGLGDPRPTTFGPTISEIHYNPLGDPGETLEFLEIYNRDPTPYDLGGYRFSDGIEFEFPPGTLLGGREHVVIVRDLEAFHREHPEAPVIGEYRGKLDNGGEALVLVDPSGLPVIRVRYRDRSPWPTAADGLGPSLVLENPFADPAEPSSWTWSLEDGGSPGRANSPPPEVPLEIPVIPEGATWRLHRGVTPPTHPISAWSQVDLDDSGWELAATGVGYGDGDDRTIFFDMRGNYVAVYLRQEFTLDLESLGPEDELALRIRYDDAFVAYLNGQEFARANIGVAGDRPAHDARARTSHEADSVETFYLPRYLLRETNTLAIEGHNESLTSSDFTLDPHLVLRQFRPVPTRARPAVVLNEWFGERRGDGWIELYNSGLEPVDPGTLALSDDPFRRDLYLLEPGPPLRPGEFLVIEEEELPFPLGALDSGSKRLILSQRPTGDIIDAEVFRATSDSPETTSWSRLPDGEGDFHSAPLSPGLSNRAPETPPLVIHEIHYHPHDVLAAELGVPARDLEFIEILNAGEVDLALEGVSLDAGVEFEFPAGSLLEAGGRAVVAAHPELLARQYDLPTRPHGPWQGSLSNRGEAIELRGPGGELIDRVRYHDGGRWPEAADGGGSSLELVDPRADNDSPASWTASREDDATDWTSIEYTGTVEAGESELHVLVGGAGEVLIDELSLRVEGGSLENYIEDGSFESASANWLYLGNHQASGITEDQATHGSRSLRLLSSGRGDTRGNRLEVDTLQTLPVGSRVTVSCRARWLRGSPVLTLRGPGHGFAHTVVLPVSARPGTPGESPSRGSSNLGPAIDRVEHFPVIPSNLQRVRVSARVRDPDQVLSVRLHFRGERTRPEFRSNPMRDDGLGRDARAGDGIYSTELPAYPVGEKVEFFVVAEDLRSGISTYPDGLEPCLFQVESSATDTAAHSLRLVLTDRNTEILTSRPVMSDELLEGSFFFEDREAYYHVGTRYRGSPWIRPGTRKSFRIRFPDDRPFHGEKRLNLDATGNDLRERASFALMRHHGPAGSSLPHSRQAHARLRFNGEERGLHEMVEPVDRDYLRRWFPEGDGGHLFKTDLRLDLDDRGQITGVESIGLFDLDRDEEAYRFVFLPRTREDLDDFTPLFELTECLDPETTDDEDLLARIDDVVDVEQVIRTLGLRLANDDWDTFGIGAKNAYFFRSDLDGRWRLLPWDSDNTFDDPTAPLTPSPHYRSLARLFELPSLRRRHLRALRDLLEGPYHPEFLEPYLRATEEELEGETLMGREMIQSFIEARRPYLEEQLPGELPFEVITPLNSDADTLDFEISGTAPLGLDVILVGQEPAALFWTSPGHWKIPLRLEPGLNVFFLTALGLDGSLIGQARRSVVTTASWPPPDPRSASPDSGPEEGGEEVLLIGAGFRPGVEVYFNSSPAGEVTWLSGSEVVVRVPPGPEGPVNLTVVNPDGQRGALVEGYRYFHVPPEFIRGDTNEDGRTDLTDAIRILTYLFGELPVPLTCRDAADINDDGKVDITDPIALLFHLFLGVGEPAPPHPARGPDPTEDSLPPCPKDT